MKLDCGKVQEITRMYADCVENIPEEEAKKEYLAHIKACEICRSDRDEILQNIALVKSFGENIPTKNGLTITQSVMKIIDAADNNKKGRFKFNYYGTAVAAVIVAVITLGSQTSLFASLFGNINNNPETADTAITEEAKIQNANTGSMAQFLSPVKRAAETETVEEESFSLYEDSSLADYDAAYATPTEKETKNKAASYSLNDNSESLKEFLEKENGRVELCVVHPEGYHVIPYKYAEKIGYDMFVRWVKAIENEELEYTPEYFKQHFSDYFN